MVNDAPAKQLNVFQLPSICKRTTNPMKIVVMVILKGETIIYAMKFGRFNNFIFYAFQNNESFE